MANPFLLVLLATVVISDFTGKHCRDGCSLSPNDHDPHSCSCYICITDPNSWNRKRPYSLESTDLAEGEAYHHLINPPDDDKGLPVQNLQDFPKYRAIYANPIRTDHTGIKHMRCPPMRDFLQYYPFAKPGTTDLMFTYHSTDPDAKPYYAWQDSNEETQWIHSIPMLWLLSPDAYWTKANEGRLNYDKKGRGWFKAFKIVRDRWQGKQWGKNRKPSKKYKNLPQLHYRAHADYLQDDPCKKRKSSFAICTYDVHQVPMDHMNLPQSALEGLRVKSQLLTKMVSAQSESGTYEESVDDSDEGMQTGYHSQDRNSVGSMGTNKEEEGHHSAPLDPDGPDGKDPNNKDNWDHSGPDDPNDSKSSVDKATERAMYRNRINQMKRADSDGRHIGSLHDMWDDPLLKGHTPGGSLPGDDKTPILHGQQPLHGMHSNSVNGLSTDPNGNDKSVNHHPIGGPYDPNGNRLPISTNPMGHQINGQGMNAGFKPRLLPLQPQRPLPELPASLTANTENAVVTIPQNDHYGLSQQSLPLQGSSSSMRMTPLQNRMIPIAKQEPAGPLPPNRKVQERRPPESQTKKAEPKITKKQPRKALPDHPPNHPENKKKQNGNDDAIKSYENVINWYEDANEDGDEDWYQMDEGYYYVDDDEGMESYYYGEEYEDEGMNDDYYEDLRLYEESVRNLKRAEQLRNKAQILLGQVRRERRY